MAQVDPNAKSHSRCVVSPISPVTVQIHVLPYYDVHQSIGPDSHILSGNYDEIPQTPLPSYLEYGCILLGLEISHGQFGDCSLPIRGNEQFLWTATSPYPLSIDGQHCVTHTNI